MKKPKLPALAPAKVNLVLEVLGKRPDGYHEVASIMQTVSLCDSLSFEDDTGLSLHCNFPQLEQDNLALKAAGLLQKATGCRQGVQIHLEKKIPVASGLGGGSSDAAATLLALNRLWRLDLPLSKLLELAAQLGSDVPFFLHRGTALVTGRGEIVAPLPPASVWLVLVLPDSAPLPEKTRTLYSRLTAADFSDGRSTRRAVETLALRKTFQTSMAYNVFDRIAPHAFPGLEDCRRKLQTATGSNVHVAGSGPALFVLADSEVDAHNMERKLDGSLRCLVVSSFAPEQGF
ncbi:MAG: 4-(cytidine 5'-diphospho)-2-C-methyl-D-erythritol kinase [Chloroflexota bacterium]